MNLITVGDLSVLTGVPEDTYILVSYSVVWKLHAINHACRTNTFLVKIDDWIINPGKDLWSVLARPGAIPLITLQIRFIHATSSRTSSKTVNTVEFPAFIDFENNEGWLGEIDSPYWASWMGNMGGPSVPATVSSLRPFRLKELLDPEPFEKIVRNAKNRLMDKTGLRAQGS